MRVAMAIYAPLRSSSQPLVWCTVDQGCSSPWLHGLFFNRNVFESGIDLFFNLIILFAPLTFIAHFIRSKFANKESKETYASIINYTSFGVLTACFVALVVWEPRQSLPDYIALSESAQWAIFPPL